MPANDHEESGSPKHDPVSPAEKPCEAGRQTPPDEDGAAEGGDAHAADDPAHGGKANGRPTWWSEAECEQEEREC